LKWPILANFCRYFGQFLIFISGNPAKLLVTSVRYNSDGNVLIESDVKIINLDENNPDLICDDLPHRLVGAQKKVSGKLFKGKIPIICGGYGIKDCRCKAFQNGSWDFIPDPLECKNVQDSAVLTNANGREVFFISGGVNWWEMSKFSYCFESCFESGCGLNCAQKAEGDVMAANLFTAETYDGTAWNSHFSESLGHPFNYCFVKINSSTLFSLGGGFVGNFFYNINDDKWTAGPLLNESRYDFSCGLMLWRNPDSRQDEKVVVVTGGNALSSTELLFLNDDGTNEWEWVSGPELPAEIKHSTMIEYNNSVILIGGNPWADKLPDNMLQLSSPKGPWTEMSKPFMEGEGSLVGFLVPDELVNCHN